MPRLFQTSVSLVVLSVIALFGASEAQARGKYKIKVRGGAEASFQPPVSSVVVRDPETFDAVIVGGGLAGLSAAVYLTDQNRKVLLLDKEEGFGGLAAGAQASHGVKYDRGAAYWTDTYPEELEILKHIGLGDFHERNAIPEPADSYYWNGQIYLGIWEKETLEKLPASFAVFKFMLQRADKNGQIPNQPFEKADDLSLDELTAAEWIRIMPVRLREEAEKGDDKDAVALYKRFLDDAKVNRGDPMGDVIGLLDLYCRSALGTTADQVSAVAFANFYISEIDTRYTTVDGTAGAAERMVRTLQARSRLALLRAKAAVTRIQSLDDHAVVSYNFDGESHEVSAKYVVFSAQLRLAPKIIDGLAGTEQAAYMENLSYANYSVHEVFVKGHPYRATYDTWVRSKDYSEWDFTDVILGRWMDPKIKGYEGLRELKPEGKSGARRFAKAAPDDEGIFTIYHPLPTSVVGQGYDDDMARSIAERAVNRLLELFPPLLDGKRLGTKITVKSVETNRWPYSVHIARPGHFKRAKIMRRPFKRVFFANNNLGTPAFEEALFRGHCAADRVLKELDPDFEFEKWTKCPKAEDDE